MPAQSAQTEIERIARIAQALASPGARERGVIVGIGDDAAVLDANAGREASAGRHAESEDHAELVWTIDAQVEGTHFRRELASWQDVGWRSFMAAASDLAAMGAAPWCALSALVLAPDLSDADLAALVEGQRAASIEAGAIVVGGNLARGARGETSITTTLLGRCTRSLTRGGAKPGDTLHLAGDVGLAAAGLRALERGLHDARLDLAVARWRRPRARLAEARALAASDAAHAAIDVSDGLALDVHRIALASGVRVVLDAKKILEAGGDALAGAAAALGDDALELALEGGEDYALVVASSARAPIEGFVVIGDVEEGEGIALRHAGAERALAPRGFDHFAR